MEKGIHNDIIFRELVEILYETLCFTVQLSHQPSKFGHCDISKAIQRSTGPCNWIIPLRGRGELVKYLSKQADYSSYTIWSACTNKQSRDSYILVEYSVFPLPTRCNVQEFITRLAQPNREPLGTQSLARCDNYIFSITYNLCRTAMDVQVVVLHAELWNIYRL